MKGSFVEDIFRLLVRSMGRNVGMYRILAILSAVFVPAFRTTLPADAWDPMWLRYSFTVYFFLIFLLSFVSRIFRHQIHHVAHFSMYLLASWASYLALSNDFSNPYLTMFFVVLMFTGISFTSLRSVLVFGLLLFSGSILGVIVWGAPWHFPFQVIGLLITSLLLVGFRLSIQTELNQTQDLMGSIYKGSPDAIILADESGKQVLDFNQVALEMFCANDNESQLQTFIAHWLQQLLAGRNLVKGDSIRDELKVTAMDGSEFWADIAISPIELGEETRMLIRVLDVTEKKKVEDSMRLSDYILQKVDHLVLVANESADLIYISPSVGQALGYPEASLLGQAWWASPAVNRLDIAAEKGYIRAIAAQKILPKADVYHQQLLAKSGERQWISWRDAVTDDGLVIKVGTLDNQDRKNALVRNAIFNIAEASSRARNPFEFYKKIHQEIRSVIDTPNFYIAVYDPIENLVSFPYYTDEENRVAEERIGHSRKAGKGLTEYAIAGKKPFLASESEILQLGAEGKVEVSGQAIPQSWLGVPMVHDDRVVGLITIQDYHKAEAFSTDELALVSFIANQGAQFVNKLQQDEALRISEERFRTIYNQAAVGIASIAPKGGFIQVNQRMCDIFGYSEEELLEIMPVDITHPLDAAIGNEDLERIHRGEIDRYSKEKRYQHKDGSSIYALLNVSAFREDGEVKFFIAVYEDITEKRRAQEETQLLLTLSTELQQSQSARDALQMGMQSIALQGGWDYGEIWWADLEGNLRLHDGYFISSTDHHAFKVQVKSELKDAVPDFDLAWENKSTLINWVEDIAAWEKFGRKTLAVEHGFYTLVMIGLREGTKDLGVMVLMSQKRLASSKSQLRLFQAASSQLITVMQRKLAEVAQRESEGRYRAISEAAFEGIVIHREGVILEVNTAIARIFSYEPDEIVALPLTELIYEEEPEKWMEKISVDSLEPVQFMGRRKDGQAIHLEAVGQENHWKGRPAHILAIRDITNVKLMEEARQAARIDARFRAYVQNSSEIIQIIDPEGKISYTSPSVQRIAGRNPEYLVGTSYLDQYHLEDRPLIESKLNALLDHPGESAKTQLRMQHVSGDWRIVQVSLVNLMDDPMVGGILLSSQDITEVMKAQKSKTESEERFRTLFAHSPDAIFLEREDGIILDVNEAGCQLHEMTREEIIGKHVADLAPDEDREAVMDSFNRLFGGEITYLEGSSVSRNGKVTPVEVRVNIIQFDGEKAIILQARDITERRKNELVLKESEERFRALVEHATEAIFVLDLENECFVEVNKNAELLFERDRQELMELSPTHLSPEQQPDGVVSRKQQRKLLEQAAKGETVVYEWVHLNRSGQEIPCEVRLNRFPSASRTLVRGSITDITERKLAEKRMLDAQEQLRIQNEKLIELAANPAVNSGNLDHAFAEITQVACETLSSHQCGIWLFDEAREHLVCYSRYGSEESNFDSGTKIPVSDIPRYIQALQDERVIAASDARNDVRTSEFAEKYLVPKNIFSVLDAPFRHHGQIAGVVWTEHLDEMRTWGSEAQNFAASMADMVTLSLEAWERKKAEIELEQTLSKMRATFDSTRDGILVVDNQGQVLEYNEGFITLSNVARATLELEGTNPGLDEMAQHVEQPEEFLAAMHRMEADPEIKEGYIYTVKDGRIIEVYVRPMKMGGEIRGRLWFLHDISDLKRAEAALLENETKFRTLFSQANDAILVMQGAFISDCNDKAIEMFGLERAQITGKALYELSPAEQPNGQTSQEELTALLHQAHQEEFVSFTWKHQRADGSPFDAEVSLNLIRIGDRELIQAFVRDITERVQAEGALRESERKNKAILDAIPDLMLRISSDGRILDFKTSERQDLLDAEQNLLDKNVTDILPKALATNAIEYMQLALDSGESQQYESEIEIREEKRDYETRLVRSGPREVLMIVRDVTERKRTEKELIKRNFELDSFVYRASHDLKAPLNSLMGLISLVENETGEAVVLRYLGMMNKSVVKLDAFIRDLADFSRNARQEVETREISWELLVTETLENLKFMENSQRVDKKLEIKSSAPFFSDPVRLGILFNNLISNAIKYQDLGRDDSFVGVEIENDLEKAVIRITDNGIGIKKDHQGKVFDLFFRASIQAYGSGMGMYIVKNAVDKLDGQISLDSDLGAGTTFLLTVPNRLPELKEKGDL